MNVTNCNTLPCDGSGPSTTSSIIGILTFAIAVLVAFRAQFYAAQNASKELQGIQLDLYLKRSILDKFHAKAPEHFRPKTEKTNVFHNALNSATYNWKEAFSLLEKFAPVLNHTRQRRKRFFQLVTYVGGPKEIMTERLSELDKDLSVMKGI